MGNWSEDVEYICALCVIRRYIWIVYGSCGIASQAANYACEKKVYKRIVAWQLLTVLNITKYLPLDVLIKPLNILDTKQLCGLVQSTGWQVRNTPGNTYSTGKKPTLHFMDVCEREKERVWSACCGLLTVDSGGILSRTVSGTSVLLLHHTESDSALQHLHREPRIDSGLILRLARGEK